MTALPSPDEPIYSIGPRGGLLVTCTCGVVNRTRWDRARWTCTGCSSAWHSGEWPLREGGAA
jgi:hypothetical protein